MANPFNQIFGRPSFRNHLSGVLEVGFSQFGPTLVLNGTLTATDELVFINDILLSVTRKSDGRVFPFKWLAFLPHRFSGNDPGVDLKMPTKFLITPAAPYPYNILFSDQRCYDASNPSLKFIKQNWEDLAEKLPATATAADYSKLFESFLKQNFVKEGLEKISNFCYWADGEYILEILFCGPKNTFLMEIKKTFSLNAAQADALKENTSIIIADLCRQPGITYFTAQVNLKETS